MVEGWEEWWRSRQGRKSHPNHLLMPRCPLGALSTAQQWVVRTGWGTAAWAPLGTKPGPRINASTTCTQREYRSPLHGARPSQPTVSPRPCSSPFTARSPAQASLSAAHSWGHSGCTLYILLFSLMFLSVRRFLSMNFNGWINSIKWMCCCLLTSATGSFHSRQPHISNLVCPHLHQHLLLSILI